MSRLAERSNQPTPSRAHTYTILQDLTKQQSISTHQIPSQGMQIVEQDDLSLYESAKELDFQKPEPLKYG